MLKSIAKSIVLSLVKMNLLSQTRVKEWSEWMYWKTHKPKEGDFTNWHYKEFYTSFWGLDESYYNGKKIIDVGCGPRGSLEWADMTSERIGMDPLADKYLTLGAKAHKMKYVNAYSEQIPFSDEYFDVVCAFNSIDHVEDLSKSCAELGRITKRDGRIMLISDIHEEPTLNEPQQIGWNLAEKEFPAFRVVMEMKLEKIDGKGVYDSLRAKKEFDFKDTSPRYGMLCLMLDKA